MNVDEKFGFNDDMSRTDVKSTQKDEGIHRQILFVKCKITELISEPSLTCITQSSPDGYNRNEDCRHFNSYVCEISANTEFSESAEGKF